MEKGGRSARYWLEELVRIGIGAGLPRREERGAMALALASFMPRDEPREWLDALLLGALRVFGAEAHCVACLRRRCLRSASSVAERPPRTSRSSSGPSRRDRSPTGRDWA